MIDASNLTAQGALRAVFADLRNLAVDAVVIGTHQDLTRGNRAHEAIHAAAGERLMMACRRLQHVPLGQARATRAYGIAASHILHTACPIWRGGQDGEADMLASCYTNCIKLAGAMRLSRIAIPEIATGIYSFPPREAARIAVWAVGHALPGAPALKEVLFCCYSIQTLRYHEAEIVERDQKRNGRKPG